jgi:hypothetical protein
MIAQPGSPYIEPVRGVGTTWYTRGPAYWFRRVGLALGCLLAAALGGWLSALVVWAAWTDPDAPIPLVIAFTVVGVVVTGWAAVATERSARHPPKGPRRGLAGNSTGLVGAVRVLVLLVFAVSVSYFLTLGTMSVAFVRSIGREAPGEHEARLRDQARRERHGNPPPLDHRRRRHH